MDGSSVAAAGHDGGRAARRCHVSAEAGHRDVAGAAAAAAVLGVVVVIAGEVAAAAVRVVGVLAVVTVSVYIDKGKVRFCKGNMFLLTCCSR